MSTLRVAGRFYSWKSGTWEPEQTDRALLRVFRFRDAAWHCSKDARFCSALLAPNPTNSARHVNLELSASLDAKETLVLFDKMPPGASLMCRWDDWFDLTMKTAAHAYLDAQIDASRIGHMASAYRIGVAVRATVEAQRARDLADFESTAYECSGRIDSIHHPHAYLCRVRPDLEARLRGEPGTVVLP
jgi:hypothetical protein